MNTNHINNIYYNYNGSCYLCIIVYILLCIIVYITYVEHAMEHLANKIIIIACYSCYFFASHLFSKWVVSL